MNAMLSLNRDNVKMLAKNQLLEEICRGLGKAEPQWSGISRRFKHSPWKKIFENRRYDLSRLAACVSEIHIRERLEWMARSYEGRVVLDPIQPGEYTPNFFFRRRYDTLEVLDKDGLIYSEIDGLMRVNALPVLVEVKLTGRRRRSPTESLGRSKRGAQMRRTIMNDHITRPSSFGLRHAMSSERVNYLCAPISEYFHQDSCGYVLVIPPECISPDSPVQRDFIKRNGLLVPFYADRFTYRQEVLKRKFNGQL